MKKIASNKCDSRNIPLPIQREVRQRCGFGCVICGLPLYHYDHMKGWPTVHEHVATDITLLCDKHHREATSGLLPREKVAEANKSPYNLKEGKSKPYTLHFEGDSCEIEIGSNRFNTKAVGYATESIPLIVDGIPLIGFVLENGHLLLNLNLFDQFNGIILRIVNNCLFYSVSPWDIQLVGRVLTIREKARKFLIKIKFDPPNKIKIIKGRFLCNGVEILVDDDYMLLVNNNMLLKGNSAINCHGGLVIGKIHTPIGCMIRISEVNRYLGNSRKSLEWIESIKK